MTTITPPTVDDALIVVVLDSSGSMSGVYDETLNGYNAFLEEQSHLPGQTLVTLTLFSTIVDERFNARPIQASTSLDRSTYTPLGGTALYDAVGDTIVSTEGWLEANSWFTGRVIFVIMTDGQENSSRRRGIDEVNKLITAKRNTGWNFIFMGAGGAAWTEAKAFEKSIGVQNTVNYKGADTVHTYAGVSSSIAAVRSGVDLTDALGKYTADVRVDDSTTNP